MRGSFLDGERRRSPPAASTAPSLTLLATGKDNLVGRPPKVNGRRLFPLDKFGHDHLWWLDRMVRTSRPLTERMTLVWHDWFATSNETVGSQRLMIRQNNMFRPVRPRLIPRPRDAGDGEPRDAAVPQRAREREGRAERELRPRADGAVHPRPRLRLHGARRARAGPGADRVHRDVQERVRLGQVPLRPQPARRRDEGRLRQARRVRLEAGRDADRLPSRPQDVLHPQALGLLHPGACRRRDPGRARGALRRSRATRRGPS